MYIFLHNLHGYNEVVILRRLPEIHTQNASRILGLSTLKVLPHDRDKSLQWPSICDIENLSGFK